MRMYGISQNLRMYGISLHNFLFYLENIQETYYIVLH
jgi:hypothetical protein